MIGRLVFLLVVVAVLANASNNCRTLNPLYVNNTLHGYYALGYYNFTMQQIINCELYGDRGQTARSKNGCVVSTVWCGMMNATHEITQDTLLAGYSLAKLISSMVTIHLEDKNLLFPDDLVTVYLPDFGKNNKSHITVEMMESHGAGLPHMVPHNWPSFNFSDVALGANETAFESLITDLHPEWYSSPNNITCGYDVTAYGWHLNPIVKAADIHGRGITQYSTEEFFIPLGIEVYFGIPIGSPLNERVAELVMGETPLRNSNATEKLNAAFAQGPQSMQWKALFSPDEFRTEGPILWNNPDRRAIRMEGGAVWTTAMDLLKLVTLLGNRGKSYDGTHYFQHAHIFYAAQLIYEGEDAVTYEYQRYTRGGFWLSGPRYEIPSSTAFFKTGAGGQLALVDYENKDVMIKLTSNYCGPSDEDGFTSNTRRMVDAFFA